MVKDIYRKAYFSMGFYGINLIKTKFLLLIMVLRKQKICKDYNEMLLSIFFGGGHTHRYVLMLFGQPRCGAHALPSVTILSSSGLRIPSSCSSLRGRELWLAPGWGREEGSSATGPMSTPAGEAKTAVRKEVWTQHHQVYKTTFNCVKRTIWSN